MGCDIHLHIEVKIDKKWEHYSAPRVDRWYKLFEKMAGVRGDVANAIVAPKGLPDDVSTITALDYEHWAEDAHTPSWFNLSEIKKLTEWAEATNTLVEDFVDLEATILNCYLFGNCFYMLPEGVPAIEDVRFVFWFDN